MISLLGSLLGFGTSFLPSVLGFFEKKAKFKQDLLMLEAKAKYAEQMSKYKIQELDDNSIDCVVSSPPYFGLRDYGVNGQFGLEKTYQDYIANTVKVFETFKPKLKDTATIWWNVGDSYASNGVYINSWYKRWWRCLTRRCSCMGFRNTSHV